MALESKRERIIYPAIVPIIAAICGALATALFQRQSSMPGSDVTFQSILGNSGLSSAEKLKALEIYKDMTDRPWFVVRTLTTLLFAALGAFGWAISDRIRGK